MVLRMYEDSARFSLREVSTEPKCFLLNDRPSSIDQSFSALASGPTAMPLPLCLEAEFNHRALTSTPLPSRHQAAALFQIHLSRSSWIGMQKIIRTGRAETESSLPLWRYCAYTYVGGEQEFNEGDRQCCAQVRVLRSSITRFFSSISQTGGSRNGSTSN